MASNIPITRILAVTSIWCYLSTSIGTLEHYGPCYCSSVLSADEILSMSDVCAGVDPNSTQRWSLVPVAYEPPQAKYFSVLRHNIFRIGGLPYDCLRLSAVCGMDGTNATLELTIRCRNESAALYQLKQCAAEIVQNSDRCLTFQGTHSYRLPRPCPNQYDVSNMAVGHVSRYLYIEYCVSSINRPVHILGFWLFVAEHLLTNGSARQQIEATLVKDMARISPLASRNLVRPLRLPETGENEMDRCNCTAFDEYIQKAARCSTPVETAVVTNSQVQKMEQTGVAVVKVATRQDWLWSLLPYTVHCVALVVGPLFTYLLVFAFRGWAVSEPISNQ